MEKNKDIKFLVEKIDTMPDGFAKDLALIALARMIGEAEAEEAMKTYKGESNGNLQGRIN